MKKLSLRSLIMLALAALFVFGLAVFCFFYFGNASDWAMYAGNPHVYTDGEFTRGGEITDCNSNVLAKTENNRRVYSDNYYYRVSTLHAVGDSAGFISTGAQNAFRKQLTGYNFVTGLFSTGKGYNNIKLTIDADVNSAAYNALSGYSGTVGVCNYKTGEMICMVTTPSFDISDETETEKAINGEYDGVFINRFLSSSYAPGSTFKMITAAAAIDTFSDAYTRTYTCKGGCEIEGETVKCTGYHENITLKEAFAVSCNSYFSQLAVDLGKSKLTEYAEKFGFNRTFYLDGIKALKSSFDVSDARTIELGWAGIGQYTDMQNPLQYLTAVCAVAGNGTPVKPYIIKEITSADGSVIKRGSTSYTGRVISESTAKKVRELMDGATEITYGKSFFGSLDVCGKTGTAEVDGKTPHAEFIGFCADEEYPFAFVVVVEEGGSGNDIAKTVANTVLQAAKQSYDNK